MVIYKYYTILLLFLFVNRSDFYLSVRTSKSHAKHGHELRNLFHQTLRRRRFRPESNRLHRNLRKVHEIPILPQRYRHRFGAQPSSHHRRHIPTLRSRRSRFQSTILIGSLRGHDRDDLGRTRNLTGSRY